MLYVRHDFCNASGAVRSPRAGLRNAAAIVGVGHTDWVGDHRRIRAGEKIHTAVGYAAVAFREALADAGIAKSDIDGLIVGPTTPTSALAKFSASIHAGADRRMPARQ